MLQRKGIFVDGKHELRGIQTQKDMSVQQWYDKYQETSLLFTTNEMTCFHSRQNRDRTANRWRCQVSTTSTTRATLSTSTTSSDDRAEGAGHAREDPADAGHAEGRRTRSSHDNRKPLDQKIKRGAICFENHHDLQFTVRVGSHHKLRHQILFQKQTRGRNTSTPLRA